MSEKVNIMERKIGEIFEFGGEWYQCVSLYKGVGNVHFAHKIIAHDILNVFQS